MSVFKVPSYVGFDNLMAVRAEGERQISAEEETVFDLSELGNASSAMVALLVAWFRYAHVRGKVVHFSGVPVELMNIIELTELTEVLPLEASS